MNRKLLVSKLFCRLLIMANLLFCNTVFSQASLGDYKSIGSGNWTDVSKWLYWDGDSWETPSGVSPYGYPGQYPGTGAVLINAGDSMTVGTSGITTQLMGTLTIDGSLVLTGIPPQVGGVNFSFNTLSIIVTSRKGVIYFIDKANLILPENATIQVMSYPNLSQNPTYKGLDGDCSAQQSIVIGDLDYAVCQGSTADTRLTFDDLMDTGGTLNATATSNSPVCEGSTINLTGGIYNEGWTVISYLWEIIGPNGLTTTTITTSSTSTTSSVSSALTAPGSPDYTVKLTVTAKYKSSTNVTNTQTIYVVVNDKPAVPELPSTLNLPCSATGFLVNWNVSTSATSYNLDVATNAGFTNILPSYNNKVLGNVLSENVSGLTVGTSYYVRLRAVNGNCISNNSNTMVVSVPTTTYNGTWDNELPDITKKVIFASNYSSKSQIAACSCQINSGVNVVFGVPILDASYLPDKNADAILKIENELVVLGTLTFENNASLIQVNDVVNTGNIVYKRVTTPMKNFDYTYWSSPVAGQTAKLLSPNTLWDKYFRYGATGWVFYDGVMMPGVGYIIRTPKPGEYPAPYPETVTMPYSQPVEFKGTPNNGIITVASNGINKSNLIGNPYPSPIDADSFMTNLKNASLIDSALYFWTHNTAIAQSGALYVYSSSDYAVYTLAGGTGTRGNFIDTNNNGILDVGEVIESTKEPNGKIAAGQSFMVKSKAAGNFEFNNSMRNTDDVLDSGSNSQFFRMSQTKKMASIEKNRVWLNLTNSGGAFKQLLVGYITGATNEIDNLYDGISLDTNAYVDFYSINSGKNLSIQGRALPFAETDRVQLGYKTTIQGVFTISIEKTDGILADQDIFIEDKITGVIVNLKNGPHTFTTATGVFNDRFVLRFMATSNTSKITSKVASGTNDKSVLVSVKNKQININSQDEVIDKVLVYDLKTSLLYEKENLNTNDFVISNFNSVEQFLIVQVLLKNGKWVTKEIIF